MFKPTFEPMYEPMFHAMLSQHISKYLRFKKTRGKTRTATKHMKTATKNKNKAKETMCGSFVSALFRPIERLSFGVRLPPPHSGHMGGGTDPLEERKGANGGRETNLAGKNQHHQNIFRWHFVSLH